MPRHGDREVQHRSDGAWLVEWQAPRAGLDGYWALIGNCRDEQVFLDHLAARARRLAKATPEREMPIALLLALASSWEREADDPFRARSRDADQLRACAAELRSLARGGAST